MFSYPNPSYAASIWTAGDRVNLILPPASNQTHSRNHTVNAVIDLPALKAIIKNLDDETPIEQRKSLAAVIGFISVLQAREAAQRSVEIGKIGAPTQFDLEHLIKNMGVKVQRVGKKKKAGEGMTLEDIEL